MLRFFLFAQAILSKPSETFEPVPQETPTWPDAEYSTAYEERDTHESTYVFVSPTLKYEPIRTYEEYYDEVVPGARITPTPEEIPYTPTEEFRSQHNEL